MPAQAFLGVEWVDCDKHGEVTILSALDLGWEARRLSER